MVGGALSVEGMLKQSPAQSVSTYLGRNILGGWGRDQVPGEREGE